MASTFNFFLPGNFQITQNANLYIMDELTLGTRNFHFSMNCGTSLNSLFNTRTYKQNSTNAQNVDINLSINETYAATLFNNLVNAGGTSPNFLGMETVVATTFSQRLLEMAALKIFGHAKARAAIANDSDFTNLHTVVIGHLTNSFSNSDIKNNFFEQYVLLRKNSLNQNDVDQNINFNLDATQIYIYGILNGSILDATPLTSSATGLTTFGNSYNTDMRLALTGF